MTPSKNFAQLTLHMLHAMFRMPLDVLRVDTEDMRHRFAVCVASYGYMGDLMKDSEKLRWMGPARYNIQGAITLFRGKAYKARVSWLAASLP